MIRRRMPGVRISGCVALGVVVALAAGCGGGGDPEQDDRPPVGKPRVALEQIGKANEPIFMSQPPGEDEDLYVVERAGTIRVLGADGKPFLDISADVDIEAESGLFSVAFAPDYAKSGLFYVAYAGLDQRLHLEEFQSAPGAEPVADPASRRSLLALDHPNPIHWGGLVAFGPDGYLYLGTGDGAPPEGAPVSGAAQDLEDLLGKLLRIDPAPGQDLPYSIPPDNPFVGKPGRDEIYALGLRNPWRYSWDRETDAFTAGDVGSSLQEEVNYVEGNDLAGANFGWPEFEGTEVKSDIDAPGAIPPAYSYERTDEAEGKLDPPCAVTGGYVVRDPDLPELEGRYVYADFCESVLRSFKPGAEATDDRSLGVVFERIASFAEDNAGHVYALSLNGEIVRLSSRD